MNLHQAETRLGITLPDRHRRVMLDPLDRIHTLCDFLVLDSPHVLLRWVDANEFLHADDRWNRWPTFLVAFASNGCSDYFAYDTRSEPLRIIYMDPDYTVVENLANAKEFEFGSFDAWYEAQTMRNFVARSADDVGDRATGGVG
jgi:hypothetical protein